MNRAAVGLALVLFVGVLSTTSCTSKHKDKLVCRTTNVTPNAQPAATTPAAALAWYLAHMAKAGGMPTHGYSLAGHTKTRYVYSLPGNKTSIGIGNFGSAAKPNWAVQNTINC